MSAGKLIGASVVALAVAGFGALLVRAQQLPEGVVPIAWDKEPCAHCRMHVGEPAFATQVQLADGGVFAFDDPGCMLLWLESHREPVHAVYLHHAKEDAWLTRAQAAFVSVEHSPMGFGLAAVPQGTPGAIDWEAARQRVLERAGGLRK